LDAEQSADDQKKAIAVVPRSHPEGNDLRCRAGVYVDESPSSRALVFLLVLATLGAVLGRFLILGARDAALFTLTNKAALELWAALIGLVCGYGLAAFVVMTRWSWQVLRIFSPKFPWKSNADTWKRAGGWFRATCLTIFMVGVVSVSIPAGTVNGRPVSPFSHQITVLAIAGIVAIIPGLIGFLAVRSLARTDSQWKEEEPRCQLLLALWLRQTLRRLLATFGLLLALYVVTTADRRQLILAFNKNAVFPQDYALLQGLLFAAFLALFHVLATMAINWRCERLLDRYAPIPSPCADDISTPLRRRQDLAAFLGTDSSWRQTFQNGVFVLAPLLTAIIGTALPK